MNNQYFDITNDIKIGIIRQLMADGLLTESEAEKCIALLRKEEKTQC